MQAFSLISAIDRLAGGRIAPYQDRITTFSILVAVNVVAAAVGWITQIQLANALGREVFGQVAFAVVIGMFGQVFIRAGLDRTLVRDLIHFPDRFSDLVQVSLYLRYALAFVLLSGLLVWKFMSHGPTASWGMVLIAMGSSLLSLDLQPVYDARRKMQRHAVYYLIIEERLSGKHRETLLELAEAERRALQNFAHVGGLNARDPACAA